MRRPLTSLLVLAAVFAAGCKVATTTRPTPRPSGAAVAGGNRLTDVSTLTGKVKIIADNGAGIISDNGGGIISDSGGSIISDNGGGVISNNSGNILGNNGSSLISNNGGGLTSKVKRGLLATPKPREFFLADAQVTVLDAAGKPVLDAAGKPITATTDASGAYTLTAPLPAGNLVLKIQVHEGGLLSGGELTAMLPKRQPGAQSAAIDTLSSLGAAYVLGKYVKGDQKTFDKLPAAEADKLRASLDGARALVTATPRYRPDDLAALTEQLRAKAPAVNQTLEEIQALLIGQSGGGDGQQALNAALAVPTGLAVGPAGELYVGEPTLGRIRTIKPDGTIATLADTVRGKVKHNYPHVSDIVCAPDGTVYVVAETQVLALAPDGKATLLAGTANTVPNGLDGPPDATNIAPYRLARGADGTLYIGESRGRGDFAARLLALDPAGKLRRVDHDGDWTIGDQITGVVCEPDGSLVVLTWRVSGDNRQRLLRLKPGQPAVKIAETAGATLRDGSLARGADGTYYVTMPSANQVLAFDASGTQRVVAGADGPAATQDLLNPGTLLGLADGSLLVADRGRNLVMALGPTGTWAIRAGTTQLVQRAGDLRSLALNGPISVAFDDQDRLLVVEGSGNRIVRFAGEAIEVVAGDGVAASEGDGGPAARARFKTPRDIAFRNGTIYVLDESRIRAIGADGTIRSVAGGGDMLDPVAPGVKYPNTAFKTNGNAFAVAPDGRIYFATQKNQIIRVELDGTAALVAGTGHAAELGGVTLTLLDPSQGDGGPAVGAAFYGITTMAFDTKGDLLVTDTGNFRVRKITGVQGDHPMVEPFAGLALADLLKQAGITEEPKFAGMPANQTGMFAPLGLAVAPDGTVYVSDAGTVALPYVSTLAGSNFSELIQSLPRLYAHVAKVTPDGKIYPVAGTQGKFFTDPTAEDGMVLPSHLALSADGRLAIVDGGANLVRILPARSF